MIAHRLSPLAVANLFTQNSSQQLGALRTALGIRFGSSVQLEATRASGKRSLEAKTGLLRVRRATRFKGSVASQDLSAGVWRPLFGA